MTGSFEPLTYKWRRVSGQGSAVGAGCKMRGESIFCPFQALFVPLLLADPDFASLPSVLHFVFDFILLTDSVPGTRAFLKLIFLSTRVWPWESCRGSPLWWLAVSVLLHSPNEWNAPLVLRFGPVSQS